MLKNLASRIAIWSLFAVLSSCGGGGGSPGTPNAPAHLTAQQRTQAAESYAVYYGALDSASILALQAYPLVIVHPYNGNITRSQIQQVQQGPNSTVVLCYISIGEDLRTYGLTDTQMLADPRFTGDGTGPSVDPRGTSTSTSPRSLKSLNPLGTPTNGGFASWYLNDNVTYAAPSATAGSPDQNPNFLTRYVNAGDPKWYAVLNTELADAVVPANYPTNPPGLKEMLTTSTGRGLGCDGVFLDTMDTAAPNSYAPSLSNFEWTAAGFTAFIKHLRADYPNAVILQNRGLFFFDPRLPHYEVNARGSINLLLFESYRLNSNASQTFDPYFFPDNKYNFAPKIMAEANRPDGFKVLSLGYANGWGAGGMTAKPGIDVNTLTNGSTTVISGYNELVTDFQEALAVGFRHYLTDASVSLLNQFVKNNAVLTDTSPPVWSSIFNANYANSPAPGAPNPRVGIQSAVASAGSVTVAWDVALDMNRVSYALYYKTTPFDFVGDPNLTKATRVVLTPAVGAGYAQVWSSADPYAALQAVYPYQQTLSNLPAGATYYLVIRAFDSVGNEEKNNVVLSAVL